MEALIFDHKEDYDKDDTQDLYISNMNYAKALMEEVDRDCTSIDPDWRQG